MSKLREIKEAAAEMGAVVLLGGFGAACIFGGVEAISYAFKGLDAASETLANDYTAQGATGQVTSLKQEFCGAVNFRINNQGDYFDVSYAANDKTLVAKIEDAAAKGQEVTLGLKRVPDYRDCAGAMDQQIAKNGNITYTPNTPRMATVVVSVTPKT